MDGLIDHVNLAFDSITQGQDDDAVVFGTEFSCCVFALTHVKPEDYFDETATKRVKRSCSSGKEDCEWKGSAKAMPWTQFQMDLARERTGGMDVADTFLNGGLVIGKAASLLKLIDLADLEDTEDDQAVFTGLMYRRPDLVLLDYGNEIFGTARFSLGMEGGGCSFKTDEEGQNKILLQHTELKSTPFLLHTPNHFFECYDMLASLLGEERSDAMKGLSSNSRDLMVVENEDYLPYMKDTKEGGRMLGYGGLSPGTTSLTEISGTVLNFNNEPATPFGEPIGITVTDPSDGSTASGSTSTTDGSFTITKTVDVTTTLEIVLTIPATLQAQGFTQCLLFGEFITDQPCSDTFSFSAPSTGTALARLAAFTCIELGAGSFA